MPPRSRRNLILEKALRAFCERGYEGAAISEIAEAAGVSKAAVSFHFTTKEQILDELVTPFLDALDEAVGAARPAAWPDGVWDATERYFDVLVAYQDVATWIDADRSVHGRPDYGGRLDEATEQLMSVITGGSKSPQRRVRALAVIGGLWRPLRLLGRKEIEDHRIEILHAALVSYAPIDPPG